MVMNIMGNYANRNEQDLVANLIEESIEQRGVYVRYILRDLLNPDELLGESSMSEFKEFYEIPMFVESVEHFNGNGDVFDAFGINSSQESAIFQVGKRRFKLDVADKANIIVPREGDLIYLPFSDSLWEITKEKRDLKYFQMGANYTYRLICKLFEFSHETIDPNATNGTDFNSLGGSLSLDGDGLKTLLGMKPDSLQDETQVLKEEVQPVTSVGDSDTFGF